MFGKWNSEKSNEIIFKHSLKNDFIFVTLLEKYISIVYSPSSIKI